MIKTKYPAYNDMSDAEVAQSTLKKYPQYQDMIKSGLKSVAGITPSQNIQVDQPKKSIFTKAVDKFDNAGKAIGDFGIGFAKGVVNAPRLAAEGGEKLGSFLSNMVSGKTEAPVQTTSATKPIEVFQPKGKAQEYGYKTEKFAEFFAPGLGPTGSGSNFLTRAATTGADMYAKTTIQGNDPIEAEKNALIGAATSLAAEPISYATKKLASPLKRSAESTYSQALAPTTKANKNMTQKIVPEFLDRKVSAFTRGGLMEKIQSGVDDAGEKVGAVLERIPKDKPTNIPRIVDDLEVIKEGYMVPGANGKMVIADPEAVAHIEQFQGLLKELGETNAPFGSVKKILQIWDRGVAKSGGYFGKTLSEGTKIDIQREAANAIRRELASANPDLAAVNKEFTFWANARKVLGDTIDRTTGRSSSLSSSIAEGAGVAGSLAKGEGIMDSFLIGKVIKGLASVTQSTGWKTVTAIQKNNLANFLGRGDLEKAIELIGKIGAAINSGKKI